jgi:hypothetical protein
MVLQRTVLYFLVVSPAYISRIMDGEAIGKVTTPNDRSGGWSEMLRTGKLSPAPVFQYISGEGRYLVEVIRLQ